MDAAEALQMNSKLLVQVVGAHGTKTPDSKKLGCLRLAAVSTNVQNLETWPELSPTGHSVPTVGPPRLGVLDLLTHPLSPALLPEKPPAADLRRWLTSRCRCGPGLPPPSPWRHASRR